MLFERQLRLAAALAGTLLISAPANAFFFFFLPIGAIQNAVQGGHCVSTTAKIGDRLNLGGKMWVIKETNGVSSRCSQYPNWPVIAKLEPYISEAEMAAELQTCLPMGASEGMQTTVSGVGEVYVRSVSNSSGDCGDPRTPVSARVVRASHAHQSAAPKEQPRRFPDMSFDLDQCVYPSSKIGDAYYDKEAGNGVITALAGPSQICPPGTPNRATVRFEGRGTASKNEPAATNSNPAPPAEPTNLACVPSGSGPGDKTSAGTRQVEIVRIVRRGPPCDSRPEAPMIAEFRELPTSPAVAPSSPVGKTIVERLRELKQLRDENLITEQVYETKQREILAGQ